MLKKLVASLEDPDRPLLGPNYWILRKFGFIWPENKLGKAFAIFMAETVTFFVFTQYLELYAIQNDLNEVLKSLNITMLSTVCVVKSNSYIFWQKKWKEVLDYVTEADKYERDNSDKRKDRILNKYTKYCRVVTYFYWALVFTTFATVCLAPINKFVSSSTFREQLRNGSELFPHVFSSWMPIDKYHTPGTWITMLWQVVMCGGGAGIMAAYDTTVIVILVFFAGKLELLRMRSRQMLGEGGRGVSNEHAMKAIQEMHEIHALLTKNVRLFDSLLSPVMFIYFVMCTLMICLSAYQITTSNDPTEKVTMAEFLTFGVAQLFMFCWHSSTVIAKSEDVVYGPYESDWWAANVYQRKAVHMVSGQFRIKHMFMAGPFNVLSLATFLGILKGSYSYYTLLNKGKQKIENELMI